MSKIAPRLVYHGTDVKAGRKIRRFGMRESHAGALGSGAYMATNKTTAERYASGIVTSGYSERKRGTRGAVVHAMAVGPARKINGSTLVYDPKNLIVTQVDGAKTGRVLGRTPYHAKLRSMGTVLEANQRSGRRTIGKSFVGGQAKLGDTPVRFNKRDSVQITGSPHEHKALIRQYGDRGPLPAGLDRETKMKAYEARYVHAGGDKSEKWNHRANAAEGSRNLALAAGTAGLAGLAALKHPRAARRLAKHPRLSHRLDATALTAGAAGGASELYGEYARHKRASYANSPGGVARSALTRMRAYTPDTP